MDSSFDHYSSWQIPKYVTPTALIEIVSGSGFGKASPLKVYNPMTVPQTPYRLFSRIEIEILKPDGYQLIR